MSDWFPTFDRMAQAVANRDFWYGLRQTPLRDVVRWKLSGRLDWKTKITTADLSAVIRAKIKDVVSATRLWRLEKSQIADELVAHFQDGTRAGNSDENLLASFGDTRTVAGMIRSSKKRNRSLAWKTVAAGGYALAATMIFYACLAIWFFSARPHPTVDYYKIVAATSLAAPESDRTCPHPRTLPACRFDGTLRAKQFVVPSLEIARI